MPRRPARKSKRISKKRKKLQRVVTTTLLFVLSVGFLGGLAFYKTLTKPFASAESSTSFDITNNDLSTLLLISVDDLDLQEYKIEHLDLIFFDKEKKEVVSFDIPLDWEVNIPGKYGIEKMSNVLSVSMMNSHSIYMGADVLRNSIEKKFAYNVDRFILIDRDYSTEIRDTFKFGKSRGLFNYDNLIRIALSIKTDLKLNEFYNLYTFVNGLTTDRFTSHNKSIDYLENSDFISTVLRNLNFDSAVAKESTSIAVLNGTDIPGVATFSSEVITNFGGHIIEIANASHSYEDSVLITQSLDLSAVKEIQRFFSVDNVILKDDFNGGEFVVNRADVILIVGLDKAESF